LECTTDRLRSGVSAWIWRRSGKPPNEWRVRKAWKIVDVEWKIGKQRFLRVYIDRVPKTAGEMSDAAGAVESAAHDPYPKISHADCERVSKQLSVILDVEELIPGPGYILESARRGWSER